MANPFDAPAASLNPFNSPIKLNPAPLSAGTFNTTVSGSTGQFSTGQLDPFNFTPSGDIIGRARAISDSIKTGSFAPLGESFQKQFEDMGQKVSMGTGEPQTMDYVDPRKQATFISKGLSDFIGGFVGHGEGSLSAIKALTATKDVAEAANIGRQVGIGEDVLKQFATQAVKTKTDAESKALLDSFTNLQKTTKPNPPSTLSEQIQQVKDEKGFTTVHPDGTKTVTPPKATDFATNDKVLLTDKATGQTMERFIHQSPENGLMTKDAASGIPRKVDLNTFDIQLLEKNSPDAPKKSTIGINSPEMIAIENMPKELQELALEAHKYGSAEEFVKAQETIGRSQYKTAATKMSEASNAGDNVKFLEAQKEMTEANKLFRGENVKPQLTDFYNKVKGKTPLDINGQITDNKIYENATRPLQGSLGGSESTGMLGKGSNSPLAGNSSTLPRQTVESPAHGINEANASIGGASSVGKNFYRGDEVRHLLTSPQILAKSFESKGLPKPGAIYLTNILKSLPDGIKNGLENIIFRDGAGGQIIYEANGKWILELGKEGDVVNTIRHEIGGHIKYSADVPYRIQANKVAHTLGAQDPDLFFKLFMGSRDLNLLSTRVEYYQAQTISNMMRSIRKEIELTGTNTTKEFQTALVTEAEKIFAKLKITPSDLLDSASLTYPELRSIIRTHHGDETLSMLDKSFADQTVETGANEFMAHVIGSDNMVELKPFLKDAPLVEEHLNNLNAGREFLSKDATLQSRGGVLRNLDNEDVVGAIAKSKSVSEIEKLLEKTGVEQSQIPQMARVLVGLDNPTKVRNVIEGFDVTRAPSLPKPVSPELQNLRDEISMREDMLNLMPGKGLMKYVSRATGQLPEVTGTDTVHSINNSKRIVKNSEFGRTGDDIVTHYGFEDEVAAQKGVDDYRQAKQQLDELKATASEMRRAKTVREVALATQETAPKQAPHETQSPAQSSSAPTSPQDTINTVKLQVRGDTVPQRVRNAIGQSEALKTQIVNRGQDAYILGRGLSPADLTRIRDEYQSGKPIADIAKQTSNPTKATAFMHKLADYYDFRLAADRAAGGETARVEHYIPQIWNLSKPADLKRFNELATQKGLLPYDGFRSQPRVFTSYAEGEAAGFTPKNPSILGDLKQDYELASNGISRQALRRGLSEAAPTMVSAEGMGRTPEGKAFVNSNIPGLEGISYHPTVDKLLKGFEPLKHPDFIKLVKETGAKTAIERSGLGGLIDRTVAMGKAVPESAKEAGFTGVMGSIYDHVSQPLKEILWNWSGFHSVNITLSHMGASTLHPITGAKGVLQSVGSAVSERLYQATVKSYKGLMVAKDAEGNAQSVFDWAVQAGAFESRGLPALGASHFNPFTGGKRLIFDREIPVLQLNLAEQAAKKGIVASSPEGLAVGKEIRTITGEINAKTMNINPNTLKNASRLFLAPGFSISKYKTILDSFTKFGSENGAAGSLARQAVIGKSAIVGVSTTLLTLLATGNFPSLQQVLMNFTVNPSSQTNLKNPKGQKLDITFPKTFVGEVAGAVSDPSQYVTARANPLLSDFWKNYTNKDYNGKPIVDPNIPESATSQRIKNLGVGHLPIGAQSIVNMARGKQGGATTALQIGGLNTRISANDPQTKKYAVIDSAKAAISNIAPDDPDRYEKIKVIYNKLTPAQKKTLNFQELLAGIKLRAPKSKANPF